MTESDKLRLYIIIIINNKNRMQEEHYKTFNTKTDDKGMKDRATDRIIKRYKNISDLVIMQRDIPYGYNSNYIDKGISGKLYYVFDSIYEYIIYLRKLPEYERTFYEVIKPSVYRKLYFDIDIAVPANDNVDEYVNELKIITDLLIDMVNDFLTERQKYVNLKRIVLLRGDRPGKVSCHIIFNDYLYTYNEFAFIYQFVKSKFDIMYPKALESKWVDLSIVGVNDSFRHFRNFGNMKIYSKFCLVFMDTWQYHDDIINFDFINDDISLIETQRHQWSFVQLPPPEAIPIGNIFNINEELSINNTKSLKDYQGMDDATKSDIVDLYNTSPLSAHLREHYRAQGKNDNRLTKIVKGRPTHCNVCNRSHDNDNKYLIVFNQSVYVKCCRSNNLMGEYIGCIENVNDVACEKDMEDDIEYVLPDNAIIHYTTQPQAVLVKKKEKRKAYNGIGEYVPKIKRLADPYKVSYDLIYDEEFVQPLYPLYQQRQTPDFVLAIKAYLGRGKSFAAQRFLAELILDEGNKRIIKLSSRQLYALSSYTEWNEKINAYIKENGANPKEYVDFKLYLEYRKANAFNMGRFDQLVIQYESLFKLYDLDEESNELDDRRSSTPGAKGPREQLYWKDYDILILDESESLLCQAVSEVTNGNHMTPNATVFARLVRKAKIILAMDGYLSNKTIECLKMLGRTPFCIHNTRMPPVRQALELDMVEELHKLIYESARNGEKFYYVCSSREKLQRVQAGLLADGRIPLVYHSRTSDEGRLRLANVKEEWVENTIGVLTTTSITVGTNFDIKDEFNKCYAYFSSYGPMVRDVMQSICRVRHFTDPTLYYKVYAKINTNNIISNKSLLKNVEQDVNVHHNKIENVYGYEGYYTDIEWLRVVNIYHQREVHLNQRFQRDMLKYFLETSAYEPVNYIDQSLKDILDSEGGSMVPTYESLEKYVIDNKLKYADIYEKTVNNKALGIDKCAFDYFQIRKMLKDDTQLFKIITDLNLLKIIDGQSLSDLNERKAMKILNIKKDIYDFFTIGECTPKKDALINCYEYLNPVEENRLIIRGVSDVNHLIRIKLINFLNDAIGYDPRKKYVLDNDQIASYVEALKPRMPDYIKYFNLRLKTLNVVNIRKMIIYIYKKIYGSRDKSKSSVRKINGKCVKTTITAMKPNDYIKFLNNNVDSTVELLANKMAETQECMPTSNPDFTEDPRAYGPRSLMAEPSGDRLLLMAQACDRVR